jgi:hypothetical protein
VKGITVYRYGARLGQVLTLATPAAEPDAAGTRACSARDVAREFAEPGAGRGFARGAGHRDDSDPPEPTFGGPGIRPAPRQETLLLTGWA